jgi:hypothetical protein
MRLLRKLVAALLAGALALSALAAPSLTVAAQSGCAPVGGATPLMSLVLPPETAPPRRSR